MHSGTPSAAAGVRYIFKRATITLIAPGVTTTALDPKGFPELGPPKNSLKTDEVAFLDFGSFSLFVIAPARTVTVSDASPELLATSNAPILFQKFVKQVRLEGPIEKLSFGYQYETVFGIKAIEVVRDKYLKTEVLGELGKTLRAAGFRLVFSRKTEDATVSVTPNEANPFGLQATLEYELANPTAATLEKIVDCFGAYAGEAPVLLEQILHGD